jgi:N-hydroxyarylamine O-acetyltransferase
VDVDAYLTRIGLLSHPTLDRQGLEKLQRAHLSSVPFENLDVFHRRGVHTGVEWSVPKIVARGRGGWCYELNGAFAALLEALGFGVKRLGATVLFEPESPIPDHLAIEVTLDRPYLVDVGFGDSFIRPLPLDSEGPHDGGAGDYGFWFEGHEATLIEYGPGGTVEPQYRFDRNPFEMSRFDQASEHLQTEPGLHWTEGPFATRLLDGGPDRVTLLRNRIKFRRDGVWSEEPVPSDNWDATLRRWFDMTP